MSTVRFVFSEEGVATDATSVVLSDSTATFGVKRDDTDAVVVADGTAMTKTATGTYEHTFDDPAGFLDSTYTYAVEAVYGGETYRWQYTQDGPASGSLVSLTLARSHLRDSDSTSDAHLQALIDGCQDWLGRYLGCAWTQSATTDYLDGGGLWLWLPRRPVSSLTSVTDARTGATVSSTSYELFDNRVLYADGAARWPNGSKRFLVSYTGGYNGASAVPDGIVSALLMLIARAFDNPASVDSDGVAGVTTRWGDLMTADVARLLDPYRLSARV